MCAKLDCYLKSDNILCTNQFGFRQNLNTSNVIIEFLEEIAHHCCISRFLKEFDTVNHDILMGKLQHNGIRGVMRADLSLIRVIGNNMPQSITPVPLHQTLHYVFRMAQCWVQYFFFRISVTSIDSHTRCVLFILLTIQQFLHPTVTITMFMPQ